MAFSTVLTPTAGVPGRSYGLFSGKGAGTTPPAPEASGKPYSTAFTKLSATAGGPGRRYGSFAGRIPAAPANRTGSFSFLSPTAGLPGRRYGSFTKGDIAVVTATVRAGGGRGRKRKRALVDGRLVEGAENIRRALTEWADRLDKAKAVKPDETPKPRAKVMTGKTVIEAPRADTITEAQAAEFAEALRAIKAREAEVAEFLAHYRALIDDEDAWLIIS